MVCFWLNLSGMSAELMSVHCETHDLSKISISETDENHCSSEIANNIEWSITPNVIEEGVKLGSKEPVALRNIGETQPAETSFQTESHQGSDHQFGAQDTDAQEHINSDTDVVKTVQNEPLAELNEMDIDRGNVEVAEEATCSVNHGIGTSSQTDVASAEICNQPTDDKTNTADASLLMDTVCPAPKVDAQPVELGTSEANMINADTKFIDRNIEDIVAVETEAKGTDEVLVEEGKAGLSVENSTDVQTDCTLLTDIVNTQGVSLETGGYNDLVAANGDNSRLEVMNEDGLLAGDWGSDGKDPTSYHMFSEGPVIDSTNSVELGGDTINVSLDDGKSQVDLRNQMDDGRMFNGVSWTVYLLFILDLLLKCVHLFCGLSFFSSKLHDEDSPNICLICSHYFLYIYIFKKDKTGEPLIKCPIYYFAWFLFFPALFCCMYNLFLLELTVIPVHAFVVSQHTFICTLCFQYEMKYPDNYVLGCFVTEIIRN